MRPVSVQPAAARLSHPGWKTTTTGGEKNNNSDNNPATVLQEEVEVHREKNFVGKEMSRPDSGRLADGAAAGQPAGR